MAVKRVLCIQDISGVGRSSMAVALPVISAMGVQACPLATALLSTHTGGFGAVAYMDETFYALEALSHYKAQGIQFDAVYSGYLSSPEQVRLVCRAYEDNPTAIKLLDPAMGDNGAVYAGLSDKLIDKLRDICAVADIITPNITECMLLLGESADNKINSLQEAKLYAKRLLCLGSKCCIIKGVSLGNGMAANVYYDGKAFGEEIYTLASGGYPGTGDIFASVLIGNILRDKDLPYAMRSATEFACRCVDAAIQHKEATRYGVPFEPLLYTLMQKG